MNLDVVDGEPKRGRARVGLVTLVVLAALAPAAARADDGVAAARDACRAARATGRRDVSVEACQRAFMMDGTPEDMRSLVSALLTDGTEPPMDDLIRASFLADGAVRRAPAAPWGYAARCDVARKLGDRELLDACTADLLRVAPDHAETKRALEQARGRAPYGIWVARLLVGLGFLLTAAHALWRRRGHRAKTNLRRATPVLTAGLVVLVALGTTAARARAAAEEEPAPGSSSFTIDLAHPEASLPSVEARNANPIEFGYFMQDVLAQARKAAKDGDPATAGHLYAALSQVVPDRGYAFGKACESFAAAGDRSLALGFCEKALDKEGVTVADFTRYVGLVLGQAGPLTGDQRQALARAVTHLAAQPGAATTAERLRCEIALRADDVPALGACAAKLAAAAPNDAETLSFQWALALKQGDRGAARGFIERARAAGMSPDGLAKMERATGGARFYGAVALRSWWGWVGLAGVLGAAALTVLAARRRTPPRRRFAD